MPKSHVLRFEPSKFQADILGWYHQNQRVLPWRVVGRGKTDPYKVWMSEIMLQQTTVPAVIPYFQKFTEKWPTVIDLANAEDAEVMAAWAGLGYYARARNLLKCARVVANDLKGKFPKELDGLLELPGIGPYTAAAIMAIAYGQPSTVVDGNIERIVSRIFAVGTQYPEGKKEIHHLAHALFEKIEKQETHDVKSYPQALMDIGASICTPKTPLCHSCPVQKFCVAYAQGKSEDYPVKASKKITPIRYGEVFWIHDNMGNIVFDKRSDNRMLGGMIGLPTSDWDQNGDKMADLAADFRRKFKNMQQIGNVYHVFTHFRLELAVWGVSVPDAKKMLKYSTNFIIFNIRDIEVNKIGLPTVFLKVARLAHQNF